jgi:FMN phosphatase YigB (HAD superfamily)
MSFNQFKVLTFDVVGTLIDFEPHFASLKELADAVDAERFGSQNRR